MKKMLTLAAVIVFVFTLAAATYAMDITASGMIRVRTAVYVNSDGDIDADAAAFDDTQAYTDSRFRLKMDLVASEDLKGVIYFEGDSDQWGEDVAGETRNHAGGWGAGGSDRSAVELKQFYIDFNVPGLKDTVPTNVRVGTQWLAIRSHVWLGADGATLRIFTQPGPIRLYLNWSKPGEGTKYEYDDTDLYSARAVLALPDFPIQPGAFVGYWNGNEYPLHTGPDKAEFLWIGVNVDGKIGPANLKTDFIFVDGEVERAAPTAANPDLDYSGWLVYADVNVPIGQFTVGGTFMYATGDDRDEELVTPGVTSRDRDGYVIPPGSEANPLLGVVFWTSAVHDGIDIVGGSNADRNQTDEVEQRWYGGVWTAKGYASFKPLDWMKVTGYAMYIGDTVDNGNAIGNAETATGALQDDDDIGIEFGAIVDLSVYKNLTYSVGAGWLLAGDALDTVDAAGINQSPDDPWAIVSQLIYTF